MLDDEALAAAVHQEFLAIGDAAPIDQAALPRPFRAEALADVRRFPEGD
jgi:hypothetical protein